MRAERPVPLATQPGRILVVDDNLPALQSTARILRHAGYEVSEASSGTQALHLLHEQQAHLVLLDAELPDIAGTEVLRRIKADPTLAGVMVVMLSAHQRQSAQQAAALNLGADGYIVRPIPRAELLARVAAQMRQGLMTAQQLRASEARYRQIVETSQEGIWIVGNDGLTRFANRRLEQMLGAERDGLLGRRVDALWDGRPPAALGAPDSALVAAERALVEGRMRCLDGRRLPVQATVSRLHDEDGTPIGMLAMLSDASRRAQVESQLRLLQTSVAQLSDAVLITDAAPLGEPGPRVVFANPAFERMSGWSPSAIVGRSPRLLQCAQTEGPELQRLRTAIARQHQVRCELLNRRRDGQPYWVELDIAPVRDADGRCTHFVSVQRDITERRRLQAERELSASRLALAADATGLATWEYEHDGAQLIADERMHRIFGRAPGGAVEPTAPWLEQVVPQDRARVVALLARGVVEGVAFDTEFDLVRPDGSTRHVSARALRLAAQDGRPPRLVGACLDLTERVQAAAAEQARAAAEQANRAKSEFIAHMSHELRTPLNAILGFSELLGADLGTSPAQRQRQIGYIHEAGRHLLALINDLLDLSRIEAGLVDIALAPVDAARLADEAMQTLRPMADEARVALEIERGGTMPPVRADATRLRQVLNNLLSNAVKYNRPGGRVCIRLFADEAHLHLAVVDDGIGMSAEQLTRLFRPFNRLGHENGPIQGTGIGLVITQQLVARLGGTLSVRSRPGEGSEFAFSLPLDTTASAAPAAPPAG